MDGVLPFLEVKAGYYLTDLTEHNSGALAVVPGSHRRRVQELRDLDFRVGPKGSFRGERAGWQRNSLPHLYLALRYAEPIGPRPKGLVRRLQPSLDSPGRLRRAGSRVGRPQLADPATAIGDAGHR